MTVTCFLCGCTGWWHKTMHGGGMVPFIFLQVFRSMGASNQLRMDTTLGTLVRRFIIGGWAWASMLFCHGTQTMDNRRICHCLLFHEHGKQNFVQPFLRSRKLLRLYTLLDYTSQWSHEKFVVNTYTCTQCVTKLPIFSAAVVLTTSLLLTLQLRWSASCDTFSSVCSCTQNHAFFTRRWNSSFASFQDLGAFNQLRMDTTLLQELILLLFTHSCHFTNCAYNHRGLCNFSTQCQCSAFQPIFSIMLSEIYAASWWQAYQAVCRCYRI